MIIIKITFEDDYKIIATSFSDDETWSYEVEESDVHGKIVSVMIERD